MTILALLPPPMAAITAMLLGAAVPSLGLLTVQRFLPHAIRSVHNDVAGFVLAIVGVIYAVLLAFIAVAVWQSFGQAEVALLGALIGLVLALILLLNKPFQGRSHVSVEPFERLVRSVESMAYPRR